MRDNRAKLIAERLRDVNQSTATDEQRQFMATNDLKDCTNLPPTRLATWQEYMDMCYHECGHAVAALANGATDIEVTVRADGSGVCRYTP
jgi:hypothetical protein